MFSLSQSAGKSPFFTVPFSNRIGLPAVFFLFQGFKCGYKLCKKCCRDKCFTGNLDCEGHRILVKTRRKMAKFYADKTKSGCSQMENTDPEILLTGMTIDGS